MSAIYLGINYENVAMITEGKTPDIGLFETILGAIGVLGIALFFKILVSESKKRLVKIL